MLQRFIFPLNSPLYTVFQFIFSGNSSFRRVPDAIIDPERFRFFYDELNEIKTNESYTSNFHLVVLHIIKIYYYFPFRLFQSQTVPYREGIVQIHACFLSECNNHQVKIRRPSFSDIEAPVNLNGTSGTLR